MKDHMYRITGMTAIPFDGDETLRDFEEDDMQEDGNAGIKSIGLNRTQIAYKISTLAELLEILQYRPTHGLSFQ